MKQLWDVFDFVRRMRRQLRFGEISRAPLQLLRLELQGDRVECEWIARSPDVWDSALRPGIRARNESVQALQDAMALRDMLFSELAGVQTAVLRAYRRRDNQEPELIIAGAVSKDEPVPSGIRSVAMRAKLYGLKFWLDNGNLGALPSEEASRDSRPEPALC